MSSQDVIKEFLVSLSYKLDEVGLKKFETGLGKTAASVAKLGAVMTASAIAVQEGVAKVSEQFEDLYYGAQRVQSTVSGLHALGYAGKQIGLSMGQMQGAVGGLAHAMRNNPGIDQYINGFLGVKTAGRDTADVLTDIVGKLKGMNFAQASRIGEMLGLNPDDLYMMEQNYDKLIQKRREDAALQQKVGVNLNELGAASTQFQNHLSKLKDEWGLLGDKMAMRFMPWAEKVLGWLDVGTDWVIKADKATGGWSTSILAVASSFGAWKGVASMVKGVLKTIGMEFVTTAEAAQGSFLGKLATKVLGIGSIAAPVAAFVETLDGGALNKDESASTAPQPGSRMYRGAQHPKFASEAMKYFQSQGWTKEQAAGIAANLNEESGGDAGAIGDHGAAYGLGQWHRDRQEAFKKWAGKDIRQSSREEQLAFVNYELTQGSEQRAGKALRGATTAGQAGALVSKLYERPAAVEEAAAHRAAMAQQFALSGGAPLGSGGAANTNTVTQTNHITINGVKDPDKAGQAAGREVAKANPRNLLARSY